MYIHKAVKVDKRYTPPLKTVVKEFPSGEETIEWLEKNGGGVYRNVLHNFDMKVQPESEG